ncbi:MAG: hypothetical protein ACR2NZ_23725 [Rubripirellula sp.]
MSNRKLVSPHSLLLLAALAGGLMPLTGCRICADCEDLAYPAYGGAWQRTIRDSGRVGSLFDPAGGKASDLADRTAPLPADAMERKRQAERGSSISDPDRENQDDPTEEPRDPDFNPENELRNRELEDIPDSEKEEELRKKNLGDINVRLLPATPEPQELR